MLSFVTYWPLILLLVIPALWWTSKTSLTGSSAKHLWLITSLRSLIVALLAVALMGPALNRTRGIDVSVVYLLDVSESVAPAAVEEALAWIQKTNDSGKPQDAHFVAFAGNPMGFATLEEMKHVRVSRNSSVPSADAIDKEHTNVARALALALRTFKPDYLKRLVLMTDGNENAGSMMALAGRLKQEGVRSYTIPIATRGRDDVRIESIMAPSKVATGEEFPLEVHVASAGDTTGDVELRQSGRILETRRVQLKSGLNRIAFHTRVTEETSTATMEAKVTSSLDSFTGNNTYRVSVGVERRPRILYVEGHPQSAHYLQQALTQEGLNIDLMTPQAMPDSAESLDSYDAVILSDVDRKDLSVPQMEAADAYVRDFGGGFILAGGENNYGEGGYSKTAIEDMLPVTFDVRKPMSTAMVVVLDRSGSMGAESKMELAKEATKAAVQLLKDTDHFGVVAFDTNFAWVVPLQPLSNRADALRKISAIGAGGNTSIYPALNDAWMQLKEDPSETKHVILLTDGRDPVAEPPEFEKLATKMAENDVTLSTVAVGAGADSDLLADIAKWGKGRAYSMDSPERVLQVFSEDAEIATHALREQAFKPIVKKSVDAFKGIDFQSAPRLLGYVTTNAKTSAEVLLESYQNEPLLARWQYGLGRAVAFTSDVKDRWAVDWLSWKGYPKFWSQLVRETMRRREDEEFDMRVERDGESARISINAIDRNGQFRNGLDPQIRIVAPDQSASVLTAAQVAPGKYEAAISLTQKGAYLFRAVDSGGAESTRTLEYSYPDEYHFYPPNTEKLRALSSQTGGAFNPAPELIFDPAGEATTTHTPLAPWLTAFALSLYILDVLLRRLRF
jgi:Ca-activated chloride channel family protein